MKRSSQVALLLMGVTGVGATGYAMTKPPPNCTPQGSPAATAALAAPGSRVAEPCPPQRVAASSSSYGGRSSWTRTNSSSNSSVWPRPVFSRTSTSTASSDRRCRLTSRSSTSTSTSRSAPTDHVAQRLRFDRTHRIRRAADAARRMRGARELARYRAGDRASTSTPSTARRIGWRAPTTPSRSSRSSATSRRRPPSSRQCAASWSPRRSTTSAS